MANVSLSNTPRLGVFVGRFQPYHAGHHHVIIHALDHVDHLLVVVGSANQPRTSRNPFTAQERVDMIRSCLSDQQSERVSILVQEDSCDDPSSWVNDITSLAQGVYDRQFPGQTHNIILVGHKKDNTSYYLDLFPSWASLDIQALSYDDQVVLSATDLRAALFGSAQFWDSVLEANPTIKQKHFLSQAVDMYRPHALAWLDSAPQVLPTPLVALLRRYVLSQGYEGPCIEAAYARHYRFPWRSSPYPPMFITADPVVFHNDHVLMIRRADYPGRGLWALPGGFVEEYEPVFESAIRELDEETSLGIDQATLRNLCFHHGVYDDPFRSVRGRVVSHAFGFLLPSKLPRPDAKINEESLDMDWVHISKLSRQDCFEDHYAIVHRTYAIMTKKEQN